LDRVHDDDATGDDGNRNEKQDIEHNFGSHFENRENGEDYLIFVIWVKLVIFF
jgi:hypothetical protein